MKPDFSKLKKEKEKKKKKNHHDNEKLNGKPMTPSLSWIYLSSLLHFYQDTYTWLV